MKNIKMVLIDLDGTLLNDYGRVSSRSTEVIEKLIDKDIKVVIATGRNYRQAKMLTKEVKGLHYLCSNGAYIKLNNEKILSNTLLPLDKLSTILSNIDLDNSLVFIQGRDEIRTNLSKSKGLINKFFTKGLKFILNPKKVISLFRKETGIGKFTKRIKDIKEYIDNTKEEFYKILVIGEKNELKILSKNIEELGLSISSSASGNIEINNEGVSKGIGLELLCKEFDIDIKDTMAIGDGGNDIEMLKRAGIGVVMGNSKNKELIKIANITTDTNKNDGVAKILETIL